MIAIKTFNINFAGLREGKHRFDYHLDKKFLENFEDSLLDDINVDVELLLDKHNNLLELDFKWKGTVAAFCDVCNENFDMPVSGSESIIVKFVNELPEDTDEPEVIYLQLGESFINIALPLYEAIILQIPIRKVHPDDEKGNPTCNQDVLNYLEQIRGDENAEDSDDENTSVWDELKKLK